MSKRNRERKDKEKEPLLLAEAVTEMGIIVGFGCTADCGVKFDGADSSCFCRRASTQRVFANTLGPDQQRHQRPRGRSCEGEGQKREKTNGNKLQCNRSPGYESAK